MVNISLGMQYAPTEDTEPGVYTQVHDLCVF